MMFRRCKNICVCAVVAATFIAGSVYAQDDDTAVLRGIATRNRVNIRSGPGVDNSIVGQAMSGDKFDIHSSDGDWFEVTRVYDGRAERTAYISTRYIELPKNIPEGVLPMPVVGRIKGNGVRVRSAMSLRGNILAQRNTGDEVMVLEVAEKWVRILPPSPTKSWISTKYIRPLSTEFADLADIPATGFEGNSAAPMNVDVVVPNSEQIITVENSLDILVDEIADNSNSLADSVAEVEVVAPTIVETPIAIPAPAVEDASIPSEATDEIENVLSDIGIDNSAPVEVFDASTQKAVAIESTADVTVAREVLPLEEDSVVVAITTPAGLSPKIVETIALPENPVLVDSGIEVEAPRKTPAPAIEDVNATEVATTPLVIASANPPKPEAANIVEEVDAILSTEKIIQTTEVADILADIEAKVESEKAPIAQAVPVLPKVETNEITENSMGINPDAVAEDISVEAENTPEPSRPLGKTISTNSTATDVLLAEVEKMVGPDIATPLPVGEKIILVETAAVSKGADIEKEATVSIEKNDSEIAAALAEVQAVEPVVYEEEIEKIKITTEAESRIVFDDGERSFSNEIAKADVLEWKLGHATSAFESVVAFGAPRKLVNISKIRLRRIAIHEKAFGSASVFENSKIEIKNMRAKLKEAAEAEKIALRKKIKNTNEMPREPLKYTAVGWVQSVSSSSGSIITHKLVIGGKAIYVLFSNELNLSDGVDKYVGIVGDIVKDSFYSEKAINVKSLTVLNNGDGRPMGNP